MNTTQREILGVSGRAVRWIIMFVLLSIATLSCKDDKREYVLPPLPPKGGNTDVIFEINVPKPTTPSTYALDKETEDQIKTVEILLFKIDPDVPTKKEYTGKPYYCDTISSGTGPNSANKHFIISLPAGGKYDIVVLANSRDAVRQLLEGSTPTTVTAKDELLKLLKIEHDTKWITDKDDPAYKPFPMWGELENETISPNLRFQTTMMRMLAKIDVTLSTPTAIASFELKEVILVNAHTMGRIVPDKGNIAPDKRVDKPTLVDGSETNTNKLHYTEATTPNVGFVNAIYTFESKMATPTTISEATFIIVKGLYLVDGKEYYYKLDLGEKKGGTIVYRHILRNFKYSIGINRIGGAGYSTLGEAITGPSSNIESTLVVWDNSELPIVVWDNDNSLGFSTDDITLGFKASTSKPLKVMTDYTEGWKVDKIVNNSGAAVDWLTLSPMKSSDDHKTSMEEIKFIVGENPEIAPRICWVYISAGALSHKVKVTQRNGTLIDKIEWNDYDGMTGVIINDNGTEDKNLTSITVTQTDGNVQTSTIRGGVVSPIIEIESAITEISVTYKGYVLDVPEDKYTHTVSTKTLVIEDRSLIGKAVHLDKIRTHVDGTYIIGNYIQVSDVDLTSYPNWVPIGEFAGSYNGGSGNMGLGFKIFNLEINRPNENDVGLFGVVADESILTKIHIASGNITGSLFIGSIAAHIRTAGTISGCTNAATVKGVNMVGGICGYTYGSIISDCKNSGTVKGTGENVGGISGWNTGTILDCKNSGTVKVTGIDVNGNTYAGGISGWNTGAISGCKNSGAVEGTGSYVGGICGNNEGAAAGITNCDNLAGGNVSGRNTVGGICGYNEGTISGTTPNGTTNAATVKGTENVGGICGQNVGTISKITNCKNLSGGDVKGNSFVGGICGRSASSGSGDIRVERCTNAATVIGTGTGAQVGGICGYNFDMFSRIIDCDNLLGGDVSGVSLVGGICGNNNNGAIETSTNAATVIGTESQVGGIVGRNTRERSKITNCENLSTGNVSGVGHVGGVCGYNEGTISGTTTNGTTNAATVIGTGNNVGGICGYNEGTISGTTLNGTTNAATVTGTGATSQYIGGICGQNYGTGSKITGCDNLSGGKVSGVTRVAGICGYNSAGTISTSTNAATVKGTGDNVGGIVGCNVGTTAEITDCKNLLGANDAVSGKNSVGGICGQNGFLDGSIIHPGGKISNCTNAATVEGIGPASNFIGGISGFNEGGAISLCTNAGTVKAIFDTSSNNIAGISGCNSNGEISDCTNSATVVGIGWTLGGIVGYNVGTDAKITNCKNLSGGSVNGMHHIGGISGFNEGGTILHCTNAAAVTASESQVGGISGYNNKNIYACINTESATVSGSDRVGGICGSNIAAIAACYNLASVNGSSNFGPVIGAGTLPENCYFGGNVQADFANTFGSTRFTDSGDWPNQGMSYWTSVYWSEIGGWPPGGTPTYPKLNTTP